MTAKTCDPKCYELAEYFLADEQPHIKTDAAKLTLALEIQQCVENEIDFMRDVMEKAS